MHQYGKEEDLTPEVHLEREWQLFQRIESGTTGHLYRTWETAQPVVVVGRSLSIADHVNQEACRKDSVPILRRFSGGGAVVLGPGCLNYALGFSFVSCPGLIDVAASYRTILGRLAETLSVAGLAIGGGTDLVLNGRKVSGNAQRRGRRALIHHGTLLYAFDAGLDARYLKEPRRQPAYRASRGHLEFIGNLPLSRNLLEASVAGMERF